MTRLRIASATVLMLFGFALLVALASTVRAQPLPLDGATIETAFAPGDGPSRLVAEAIGEARSSVRMMTYQLSNGRIINALRHAAGRGIDVKVIIDAQTCGAKRLQPVFEVLHRAGVEASCDGAHPIHHNKVVIVDDATVVTGSFNFSASAEKNAENVAVIRGAPALAAAHLAVWAEHRAHAEAHQ